MTRTKVQIEKQTKKAFLVFNSEGQKGWIQKRWLNSESTVNSNTFNKSVKEFRYRQKANDDYQAWANSNHKVISIKRETEKAIAVNAVFDAYNTEKTITRLVWVPKSLIHEDGVPGWFIAKKITQLEEEFYLEHNTGMVLMAVEIEDCENLR